MTDRGSAPANGRGIAPTTPDPVLGRVIRQRYRLIRYLSEGPIGALYLAEDLSLGQLVALRVLGRDFGGDAQFVKALGRHAVHLTALSKKTDVVVKVHDIDETDESAVLIAMEHVEGRTLADVLREQGPLPVGRALRLALQIAEGLEAAHALGLLHGGLTPRNVLVTEADEARLMDFGLAGLASITMARRPWYRAGVQPEYLAPEQLADGVITDKTDVYAFGTVLYQLLCGAAPFTTTGPNVALAKQMYEAPGLPQKSRRRIPPSVRRLLKEVLERRPERRPDIPTVMESLFSEAQRVAHRGGVRRRSRAMWTLATSCAVLVLVAVSTLWLARSTARSRTIDAPPVRRVVPASVETLPALPALLQPDIVRDAGPETQAAAPIEVRIPAAPPAFVAPAPEAPVPSALTPAAPVTPPAVPPPAAPVVSAPSPAAPAVVAPQPFAAAVVARPPDAPAPATPVKPIVKAAPTPSAGRTTPVPTAPTAASRRAAPIRDEASGAASLDPSDPAGVIDWLMKENSAKKP